MTHDIHFLRLNINDEYNNNINNDDISNQLCNQYRIDHWMKNTSGGGFSFDGFTVCLF